MTRTALKGEAGHERVRPWSEKLREGATEPGDPRPSLQERYPTHADYVAKVTAAANALVARRLLLPEDATYLITQANGASVP